MLRAAIFLDHANFFLHMKDKEEFKDYRIDYNKLKDIVLQGHVSAGNFAFLGVTDPIKPTKKRFMDYLESTGFILLPHELIRKPNGKYTQGDLDTYMTINIYDLISIFDIAIILSGDVHFTITVEILRKSLKDVHIWSWKEDISPSLLKETGEENVFYIDSIWDEIKLKRTSSR